MRIINVVAGFANLLGVEVPIISLNLKAALLRIDDRLDVFGFASGFCGGGGDDGIHEAQRGFRCFGHLIFELPGSEARIAEEFGLLRTELSEASNGVAGIVGATGNSGVGTVAAALVAGRGVDPGKAIGPAE